MTDTKEIRDARESVTEIKENIQIANMQKELSSLNDIMDDLDKKIEESNDYYDSLIEQAEKYWDSLIEGLENYKSRWQELTEIEEQAKMEIALRNLGITTDDVLNMSESAFNTFKGNYLGLLQEMYAGNDDMIGMLQKFGGISTESLTPLSSTLGTVADNMDRFTSSAGNANVNASGISESVSNLNGNASELNGALSSVSDNLDSLLDDSKLATLAEQTNEVAASIQEVSDALNEVPDIDISDIIAQFDALENSVGKTAASISGGSTSGSESAELGKNASNTKNNSSSVSGGLIDSVKALKSETDKAIGTGESSGAIGQFDQLEQSITEVTAVIGGSENRKDINSEGSLISSIENLGETTAETLGETGGDGAIGRFEEFKGTIVDAEEHIHSVSEGLAAIDGQQVECTIKVNIETNGGLPDYAEGTSIHNAVNSISGDAHVEGTAKVTGDWAVQSDEKNALVGEVGRELIVRGGKFFTVGDNGAEMFDIQRGDIVFNHEQTEALLKNGHISGRGKAYADGTVGGNKFLAPDGQILMPIEPGDRIWEMQKAFEPLLKKMDGNIEYLASSAMIDHHKQMEQLVNHLNTTNIVNNRNSQPYINIGDIHVTCPGVTEQQVAEQIGGVLEKELNKQFSGFHNYTDQMSSIR